MTIWKYEIKKKGENILTIPQFSRLVKVGSIDNTPYAWFYIPNINDFYVDYHIYIYDTGDDIPFPYGRYFDTIIYEGGRVQHVFV